MEQTKAVAIGQRIKELLKNTTATQMLENCQRVQAQLVSVKAKKELINSFTRKIEVLSTIRGKNVSEENFAQMLGISRLTLRRVEDGDIGKTEELRLNDEQISWICTLTNTHPNYVMCETDIKDPAVYHREMSRIEDEALEAYENEEKAKIESLRAFFNECGYLYEYIGNEGWYMFADDGQEPAPAGPHKLTEKDGDADTFYLSSTELEELKSRLSDTIAFEHFRIIRRRDKENGNG